MDSNGAQAHTGPAMKVLVTAGIQCCAAFGLALLTVAPAVAQGTTQFDNLVRSPYVHCAFYREYEIDLRTGDRLLVEGHSNSLMHYQRRSDVRMMAIDTRRAGARDALVLRGKKYLHFIEYSAGLYVVTTIYACLERDAQGTCINYGAVNARHFDSRVLLDPDAVYEALQASAEPGFCDHSFINVQEAARRSPQ
jgi:hypothetical protein